MKENEALEKIDELAKEATEDKKLAQMTLEELCDCRYALLEIRDIVSERQYETREMSDAGKQVLDTIGLCNALNMEARL